MNEQKETVDKAAARIIRNDIYCCVSTLVSGFMKVGYERNVQEAFDIDEDDLIALAYRDPDSDDFADGDHGGHDISVTPQADGSWTWTVDDTQDLTGEDTAHSAWQAAFDYADVPHPDGSEIFEHWAVSDWLAHKLEQQGERVVRDFCGLTIWGRATTGQMISMDGVMQRIAADMIS